jgi:molybdopterin-containing oxidoreductase family iron-sulfur binding subunit
MSSRPDPSLVVTPSAEAHARFWRSIREAEADGDMPPPTLASITRRDFMKVMGASLALAGAGCGRNPDEKILPYVRGPAQETYGKPVFYASVLPHDGYGIGVLVETNMGRPTKIEGNPSHPASLGATDVFRQASVLELWDPDRSRSVREGKRIATWEDFLGVLHERLRALAARGGDGLRLLTGTVASPSLHARIEAMLARFPNAHWHQWQPVNRDNVHAGGQLAFGEPLETQYRFDRARTVLALDGDFLDDHPGFVRHALDFAATRHALAAADARSRLYALECSPSLTGANADHRHPLRASDIEVAARQIAGALGVPGVLAVGSVLPDALARAIVADLRAHAGASIVVAGARQPAVVHAIAHAINAHLGNAGRTLSYTAPIADEPVDHTRSLRDLVSAMSAGEVNTLLVCGANPSYSAPADIPFEAALTKVPLSVHHGLYVDETALGCRWHVPAAHALESWGDLRSFDGTVALQQPCIAPLYSGKTAHELVAALSGDLAGSARDLVLGYWTAQLAIDRGASLDEYLRSGVVSGSARPERSARLSATLGLPVPTPRKASDIELVFMPDPRAGDGAWANNAWLQELPKPVTQLTWDNAALMSPALARRLAVANEDVVELRAGERVVRAPVWIVPGMPDASVTLSLGYGRTASGQVADGRGANAYALRTSDAAWIAAGVAVTRTSARQPLACTQTHNTMEGRDIVRLYPLAEAEACAGDGCDARRRAQTQPTLYDSPPMGPLAWAMSVDLSSCIGCGACTIACQAENNIPVVGADEVRNGREMHWIRVDRYYAGPVENPRTVFQPVPCMQCEHAPCEVVCPVEASVHDAQGINVQVYNRCVGTRFCSNNCPYKVRRFNFLQYSDDVPGLDAQRNPEVTVRMRGVMEKCNYCLQRITTAKIAADREGRALRDGEVVTACQAVCPTRAIAFGDLALEDSEVKRRKSSPLDYALLAELNTRPRTTYLARIVNPVEGIGEQPTRAGFESAKSNTGPSPASGGNAVTEGSNNGR